MEPLVVSIVYLVILVLVQDWKYNELVKKLKDAPKLESADGEEVLINIPTKTLKELLK